MAEAGDRTEAATPKRREEARKKGQVARSSELGSVFVLFVGFIVIWLYSRSILAALEGYIRWIFSPQVFSHFALTETNIAWLFMDMTVFCIRIMAPFCLMIMVVGLAINLMQVGLKVSWTPLQPSFNKLNPLSGFKRLFSMRAVQELFKSLIKLSIVAWISYKHISALLPQLIRMTDMGLATGMVLVSASTLQLILKVCLVMLVLAILDWIYQKYEFEKSIKMSKQEVKDEYKQREGDPLVRSRIRQKQREIAFRRMMAEVPKADVVITNPTRIAIALSYVSDSMHAPKVVAKGAGVVAERIREVAKENNVPMIEDRMLAQALFKATDIGDFVPPDLFKAVAEILAYVYRVGQKQHSFGI